jgi:DNA-binding response OmpR family regulator
VSADGKHILLVEDDPGLRDLIVSQFGDHSVLCAAHRRAAYEALEAGRFDLVLLDLRLPIDERDISPSSEVGFAILRAIRQQHAPDQLPVIVMTAFEGTSETTVRAFQSGANDYWSKDGSHRRQLPEVVEGNLKQQAERKEAAAAQVAQLRHRLDFHLADSYVVLDGLVTFRRKPYELLLALRKHHLEAVARGTPPSFLGLSSLTRSLHSEQDQVRKIVQRLRHEIAAAYLEARGAAPDPDAVIESVLGTGYRLNVAKVEVAVVG